MPAPGATAEEKLAALHERLTEKVAALRTGDEWVQWLGVASKFHNYSFKNTVAILVANPDATQVAGYRAWQALGRQVTKGEAGIPILAPIVKRGRAAGSPEVAAASTGSPPELAATRPRVVGYRIAYVWDVSQTTREALPEKPSPQLLAEDAPEGL